MLWSSGLRIKFAAFDQWKARVRKLLLLLQCLQTSYSRWSHHDRYNQMFIAIFLISVTHPHCSTGDEAYHADCFQCVSCKRKIDDLVFTQTSKVHIYIVASHIYTHALTQLSFSSQGIHCTPCHEKRRAEKQRRREEREKRLQLKQQAKELPAVPPTTTTTPLAQVNDNIWKKKKKDRRSKVKFLIIVYSLKRKAYFFQPQPVTTIAALIVIQVVCLTHS